MRYAKTSTKKEQNRILSCMLRRINRLAIFEDDEECAKASEELAGG